MTEQERKDKIIESITSSQWLRIYKIDDAYRDSSDYYQSGVVYSELKNIPTALGYWLNDGYGGTEIVLIETDDGTVVACFCSWEEDGMRDYILQNQPGHKYTWEDDDGLDRSVPDVITREKLSNVIEKIWVIENHPNLHLAGGLSWSMVTWATENINIISAEEVNHDI